jgi:Uma2 family endonuclease
MAGSRLTLAQFLARPPTEPPEELHAGAVTVKPTLSEPERWLRSDLGTLLFGWARASRQGAAALAVRCVLGSDVYVPDAVYVRPERLSSLDLTGGALTIPPDLVVEICPAAVDPAWFAERAARYQALGVRAAWLVDTAEETVTVYTADAEPMTIGRGAVLDAGDLLPGFYAHLDDLFDTLLEEAHESS